MLDQDTCTPLQSHCIIQAKSWDSPVFPHFPYNFELTLYKQHHHSLLTTTPTEAPYPIPASWSVISRKSRDSDKQVLLKSKSCYPIWGCLYLLCTRTRDHFPALAVTQGIAGIQKVVCSGIFSLNPIQVSYRTELCAGMCSFLLFFFFFCAKWVT